MTTITLTEVVGEPREWSPKDNPERKFKSYRVKADDGTVYEINRKPESGPPELGPGEYQVTPSKGDFPAKLKKVFAGGGRGGRSPEETARIERQSARRDAIAYAAIIAQVENRAPSLQEVDNWARHFYEGVGLGGGTSSGSSVTPPPVGGSPAAESSAEEPATPSQKRAITTILNQAQVSKDLQAKIVHSFADPLTKSAASRILDLLNDEAHSLAERVETLIQVGGAPIISDAPADTSDLPSVA